MPQGRARDNDNQKGVLAGRDDPICHHVVLSPTGLDRGQR